MKTCHECLKYVDEGKEYCPYCNTRLYTKQQALVLGIITAVAFVLPVPFYLNMDLFFVLLMVSWGIGAFTFVGTLGTWDYATGKARSLEESLERIRTDPEYVKSLQQQAEAMNKILREDQAW